MPILKATLVSDPIIWLISGTRRQNFSATEGLTVARVNAASGPGVGVSVTVNGATPDQTPRAEVGVRNTVQFSTARRR